jgi:arginase
MTSIDEKIASLPKGIVAVVGIPLDENSSFLRGAALGPPRIREVLLSGSSNMYTELGTDLGKVSGWTDVGDLELTQGLDTLNAIEKTMSSLLTREARILSLGGDHSITHPIIKAFARKHRPLTILHVDAHPDTYDIYDGNRYSHACPFARIMEERLADRLIQVGVRTMNLHQRQQAERFGIEVIEMKDWSQDKVPTVEGPVYLSLDLDGLDPAFAPGVSHHEPGGLSTRDVLRIVHALPADLVGADIVEFNPSRDSVGVTAMVAAKFYKEIVGHMLGPMSAQKS